MYGSVEPNGTVLQPLDEYNGHMFKGTYHHHGTKTYPFANGGMRGVVTVKDGQVEPQPVANPFRPAGEPLRGATITEFARNGSSAFALAYTLSGSRYRINYTATLQSVSMTFIDPNGKESTQTYARKA